ncbi:MAG: hypothetical protein BA861_10015 [Desulfobacterales bacterium S3730MH5]|nr:MAG: hypothetical protein BA861_10015 [Desulfobacterales bacterium S3730MH5]
MFMAGEKVPFVAFRGIYHVRREGKICSYLAVLTHEIPLTVTHQGRGEQVHAIMANRSKWTRTCTPAFI